MSGVIPTFFEQKYSLGIPYDAFNPAVLNGIKVRVFFEKKSEKSTCVIMVSVAVTFVNQIFL